ncbi:hypothetical protein [Paraburkholderia terricola]|uniref:Condensation domain-containing protein n=1 Tax=Paraburkholderia terricola TaxID=169427 RepID=A0ABU1M271_9BURK|nr:hypothetical protein [Paraburkholderia terricola]MDR6412875.1 hypothetical protein [Paraburkholderia terricola]MDR6484766.1 hypothetical protein [Paraburkholderia terricola]
MRWKGVLHRSLTIEQLAKRYNANLSTATDTAATPSQWRDFVMQQRADARGQQSSRPAGALPSAANATATIDADTALTVDAFNTVHRSLDIPPSLTRLIRSVGAQYQCSPFTLLLAATQLALLSHDTSREAAIDIPMAGQSLHYLPTLVGQCSNWVAIHRPAMTMRSRRTCSICSEASRRAGKLSRHVWADA